MKLTTADLVREIRKIVKNNPEVFNFDFDKDESDWDGEGYELHKDYETRVNKDWKRSGKSRLSTSVYCSPDDVLEALKNGFWDFGYIDEEYVKNNEADLGKCWCRGFIEPDGDNFAFNIVTDPKDEKIIFYDVHID